MRPLMRGLAGILGVGLALLAAPEAVNAQCYSCVAGGTYGLSSYCESGGTNGGTSCLEVSSGATTDCYLGGSLCNPKPPILPVVQAEDEAGFLGQDVVLVETRVAKMIPGKQKESFPILLGASPCRPGSLGSPLWRESARTQAELDPGLPRFGTGSVSSKGAQE